MPVPAALALVVVLLLTAPPARGDELVLVGGEVRRGVVVTDESAATVTFEPEAGGASQTLPTARVREVVHAHSSDAFRVASECEAAGRFDDAANLYFFAAQASLPPPQVDPPPPPSARALRFERQYGLFRAAECRLAQGRDAAAGALYRALLTERPTTRFRGESLERLARLALAVGDLASARATFEELREDAVRAGLGRRWQLRAELLLQQIDEAKDVDAALRNYVAFESRAAEFPDVKNLARLRAGRLRLARGEHERALAFFENAFAERELLEVEIAAGASNGRGLCRSAKPGAVAADHRAALDDFLRTLVHYGPRLGRSELVAEALVEAARELAPGAAGANDRVSAADRERARALLDRCVKEYPGSRWAQRAAELR